MARPIVGGRSVQVRGLRELQARARDLIDTSKGAEAAAVVSDAARIARNEVTAHAMAVHVPHEVLEDVFSYGRPNARDKSRGRVTGLVGIRKRGRTKPWAAAYVEWGKRTGKTVGENLATMWELGTSKMPARPFFRPGITASRAQVIDTLAAGYRAIIARHAR